MTVTQRRLRAVFLCLFAVAGIVLLLAFATLVSTFAQVNRAMAQSTMVCQISFGTVDEAMDTAGEFGLEFHQLAPFQADQYIAAILPTRPAGSEGLRAIVTAGDGGAILQMVDSGILCTPILRVTPQSHERAISAAMGQPA